ncbi:MAG TPA: lytic transglycosylase domain-containing protein [Epulopiscium sp.]|nr:lytic transglycosylase domain-containing protein [Candidatus Epulonipiscium sp.]
MLPTFVFPMTYKEQVFKNAKQYNVDPLLVFSIIKAESKFNPNAISKRGAKGLMQIMDTTGEWAASELKMQGFTKDQLFDPTVNINIGCWYVAKLLKQYEGDIPTLLAAYNAGTGNVYKWRNNKEYSLDGVTLNYIPFGETRKYIEKVSENLKFYRYLY